LARPQAGGNGQGSNVPKLSLVGNNPAQDHAGSLHCAPLSPAAPQVSGEQSRTWNLVWLFGGLSFAAAVFSQARRCPGLCLASLGSGLEHTSAAPMRRRVASTGCSRCRASLRRPRWPGSTWLGAYFSATTFTASPLPALRHLRGGRGPMVRRGAGTAAAEGTAAGRACRGPVRRTRKASPGRLAPRDFKTFELWCLVVHLWGLIMGLSGLRCRRSARSSGRSWAPSRARCVAGLPAHSLQNTHTAHAHTHTQ
jgi:hypothetical protein